VGHLTEEDKKDILYIVVAYVVMIVVLLVAFRFSSCAKW